MTVSDPTRPETSPAAPYGAPTTPSADGGGPFVWHDLMSAQPARSVAFYRALFGWRAEARELGSAGTYTSLHADARPFGGVVPLDPRYGIPAHWVSYVYVDDVDATCARAAAAGGRTCIAPTDIPNVGRFAMIEDPSGAVLAPISLPERPDGAPPNGASGSAGTAWWHELASPNPAAAAAFYRAVFGWRVQETSLRIREIADAPSALFLCGGVPMGGLRYAAGHPGEPARAHWLVYVAVDDADAAVARALSLGATRAFPCVDRADVPGVGRVGGFVDPSGATIAVAATGRA